MNMFRKICGFFALFVVILGPVNNSIAKNGVSVEKKYALGEDAASVLMKKLLDGPITPQLIEENLAPELAKPVLGNLSGKDTNRVLRIWAEFFSNFLNSESFQKILSQGIDIHFLGTKSDRGSFEVNMVDDGGNEVTRKVVFVFNKELQKKNSGEKIKELIIDDVPLIATFISTFQKTVKEELQALVSERKKALAGAKTQKEKKEINDKFQQKGKETRIQVLETVLAGKASQS